MANFVIIVDPDPDRRSRFIKTIEPLLPPVEGLVTNSCATVDFHAIWAANPTAPISCVADEQGAAVIWGEAIPENESERVDASTLRNLWKNPQSQAPICDGFYAAVVYEPNLGLAVGADIIGLFPVYYYTCNNIALVASSPELFRHHPLFKAKFNPEAFVGVLLINGLVDSETLWQNVRRLQAGYLLKWQSEASPKEIKQYQFPDSSQQSECSQLSFAQQIDILDDIIEQALARQAPKGAAYSLLLSGGLDSRMLAGFLHRRGIKPAALTCGVPSDLEMQCAVPVARTLGLEHHQEIIPFEEYPRYTDLLVKWEHLANGGNGVHNWGFYSLLKKLAPKVVAGYSIELVIAGKGLYTIQTESLLFETFFAKTNSWGLTPMQLNQLLQKKVFGEVMPHTLEKIKSTYENYSDLEFRRAQCFDLYHRQRFHIGSTVWRLSFGAWPVLPILDRQLLETTATFPVEMVANRRAQNKLVCTRFPSLAQLPLDRNAFNTEPLLPSPSRRRLAPLFRLQQKWRKWEQKLGREHRYYYRTYDINNPGWQAVRRQAEPYREKVRDLFQEEGLNQFLPPPNVPIKFKKDGIIEASSMKALLVFLLWSREHL